MQLIHELREFGLTKNEIIIYLYLLEQGVSTPPQIAKGTKITRTNTYHLLQKLKEQGLIEEQKLSKQKKYVASDPAALLRSLDKKKEHIQQILPDLQGLFTTQKNKPKIKYFEGEKSIKELYLSSLQAKIKLIYGLTSTQQIEKTFGDFLADDFSPKTRKKQIFVRDIVTTASTDFSEHLKNGPLKGYYDYKKIPPKKGNIFTDMMIWDDNIMLVTLVEPLFATLIINQHLAQTFKVMHDLIWDSLE